MFNSPKKKNCTLKLHKTIKKYWSQDSIRKTCNHLRKIACMLAFPAMTETLYLNLMAPFPPWKDLLSWQGMKHRKGRVHLQFSDFSYHSITNFDAPYILLIQVCRLEDKRSTFEELYFLTMYHFRHLTSELFFCIFISLELISLELEPLKLISLMSSVGDDAFSYLWKMSTS